MPLGPDVPLDEVMYFDITCHAASTGAVSDADATPTFAVYEEATDTDIGVGGNLTKRTSLTGDYRGTFTLSTANGFEVGKWYSIIASATVSSITAKQPVGSFRCVAAEAVAGYPKVDLTYILGTLLTETAGQIAAGFKKLFDVATPVLDLTSVKQTGDSYARLGASVGASVSADIAAVKTDTAAILLDTAEIGAAGVGLTAVTSKTDNLPTDPADESLIIAATDAIAAAIAALNNLSSADVTAAVPSVSDILTTQMTEAYAANGVAPTLAQALFAIHQHLMSFAISGTTLSVKKLDQSTEAFAGTLDDATSPTGVLRS